MTPKQVDKKRVKIAVKVVGIFGNDTMTIVEVPQRDSRPLVQLGGAQE
jgi:hypothetical protein